MLTSEAIRELLDKCKELDAKATKGPWERYNLIGDAGGLRRVAAIKLDPPPLPGKSPERKQVAVASCRSEDAAFIAFARTALPQLVEVVEGLQAAVDSLAYYTPDDEPEPVVRRCSHCGQPEPLHDEGCHVATVLESLKATQ